MFDPNKVDLLLVDDDAEFRGTVARRCLRRGFQVQEATSGEEALGLTERRQFDVAVLDMVMPGLSGLQLLEKLKGANPECEVIMLTGQGTIETAVQAMKLGAIDFLSKPFPLAELEVLIENAYETGQLRKENRQLKTVIKRRSGRTGNYRQVGRDAGSVSIDRSRRPDRQSDLDSRRKRHRQGIGCSRIAPPKFASRQAAGGH